MRSGSHCGSRTAATPADVGTFTTAAPDWTVGDTFYDARRALWRIVRILDDPEREPRAGDVAAVFVVEPA